MRRLVPWALVGLVTVAGLAGALVGVANQPSTLSGRLNVSEIIAATRAAGTARFANSSVVTSPNPLLRSVSVGRGVADFRTSSVTSVERNTSMSIQGGNGSSRHVTQTLVNNQTWVGHTYYVQLGLTGQHFAIPWIKSKVPAGSSGLLGVLDEVDPVGFLDGELGIRGTTVEPVRSEVLGGLTTTRYRVVVPTCAAPSSVRAPQGVLGVINVWLDGQGRLVQVRDVMRRTDTFGSFTGRSTTISTIRFFDYGDPVTIAAPKVLLHPGEGAVAILTISPKACPR